MYLKKISLINFKNFPEAEIEFGPKINIITGPNGVGKTNLLDAIHYLSMTKSYFNSIDTQNIRYGEEFMVIEGWYERDGMEEHIYCGVKKNQNPSERQGRAEKQFRRNKKEYQRLSDHIGLIPVVIVTPEDSALIREGSNERRKFINSVIAQYDKIYLEDLITYNHALAQRNALLKTIGRGRQLRHEDLEPWDEQLVPPGNRIYEQRKKFLEQLIPVFLEYYDTISLRREKAGIIYQSQLENADFQELLRRSFEKDCILQYTSTGIHKDELLLSLHDQILKRFGSQGQQKTFLVALKLAEFDFINRWNGQQPVLLLDDIFDKFDADRVQQIIHLAANDHFGQIFIADTNKNRISSFISETRSDFRIFEIAGNSVTLIESGHAKK